MVIFNDAIIERGSTLPRQETGTSQNSLRARLILVTIGVMILTFWFHTTPAHAQAELAEAQPAPARAASVSVPASESLKPPLPFSGPQIGPIIKRGVADDVNHRTTAFIPTADMLATLTPIEMPNTDGKWIRVDLSEQMVIAYVGKLPVPRLYCLVRPTAYPHGNGDVSYSHQSSFADYGWRRPGVGQLLRFA